MGEHNLIQFDCTENLCGKCPAIELPKENFNAKHGSINLANFTGQIATEKYLTTDLAEKHCNGQDLTTELAKENLGWKCKGDPATTAVVQHKNCKSGKGILVRTVRSFWEVFLFTNTSFGEVFVTNTMKCSKN